MTFKRNIFNEGFIALVSVIMISSILMVMVLLSSQEIAVIYDEMNHKQYRIQATQAALYCLDQVFRELEHDYFYTVGTTSAQTFSSGNVVLYPKENCSILSVSNVQLGPNSATINNPGSTRNIIVSGTALQKSVTAQIHAEVLINNQNISLISSEVIF